jgi:DnaJ homolog subfamily B member 13
MSSFYADLEITAEANTEQIAQAYRRLSLQLHPLRNPADQQAFFTIRFCRVSQAYEVLSNPKTRAIYDKQGLESLRNGTETVPGYVFMGNPFRIFCSFFGSENPWFDQLE